MQKLFRGRSALHANLLGRGPLLPDSRWLRHRFPRRRDSTTPSKTIASRTTISSTTPTPASSLRPISRCPATPTAFSPASTPKNNPTTAPSWNYSGTGGKPLQNPRHVHRDRAVQLPPHCRPLPEKVDFDPTLQNPNCVFQLLKKHYSRYTPGNGRAHYRHPQRSIPQSRRHCSPPSAKTAT